METFYDSNPFVTLSCWGELKVSSLEERKLTTNRSAFTLSLELIHLTAEISPNQSILSSVPRVEIVDERGLTTPDKFYKTGSTIELKCVVSKVPQPTSYVQWKHGLRMLNYDTSRGGIR